MQSIHWTRVPPGSYELDRLLVCLLVCLLLVVGKCPTEVIAPVCMFLVSDENSSSMCLGCVGSTGEKFCTKRKVGNGEQDTCGINAHGKKALLVSNNIYYWESGKNHGYLKPFLPIATTLAESVYDLRAEPLSRIQFKELVDLVQHGDVGSVEELIDSKDRIINPS
jgi:hypothetical protein